jgi:hypothetical protein
MKQNVIFWVGVKNSDHNDKYDNFEYFEYSKATWQHFCKRFNCKFVEFNEPIQSDLKEYRINWQKAIYVFDILDALEIEYDQIALVDSTCMYKWNAPNFFNLTNHKFTAWRDTDNMNWIYQSIQGYKDFFGIELDITKYVNSGFMIFNSTHKPFFESFKCLYEDNKEYFIDSQDHRVRKGNEQTPLNYWLQVNDIELNIDLPIAYKLTHMPRKELFSYNWQLNIDPMPFFIKYGYNWIFNGFPKDQRSQVMKQIWNQISHFYDDDYIMNKTRHKHQYRKTISYKFKEDLMTILNTHENKTKNTVLELGCCRGDLSYVLSEIFKNVIAVDISPENIEYAKNTYGHASNIEFIAADVFNELKYPDEAHTIIIDNRRDKESLTSLIEFLNKKYSQPIIVQVDYGNTAAPGIKDAIHHCVDRKLITIDRYIGENIGVIETDMTDPNQLVGKPLVYDGPEGIICNLK